ncbi:hypothetical protein J1605_001639, partial [Eschrichtius robustus]
RLPGRAGHLQAPAGSGWGGGRIHSHHGNRRRLAFPSSLRRSREGQPAARREEDPRGMTGEEAMTAVAMPEAGRDGEQSRPPAGLGCGARGETGGRGPQESRKQCEFPFSLGPRGGTWARRSGER